MTSNGTESNKIGVPRQRAIAALLTTRNVVEAAKLAKVGQRTLFRWLGEPAFRAALTEAESSLIDATTRRLLQHQETAITVILSIMADKQNSAGVRLRAATTIVEFMLKLRELRNVEERLTALEANYAQQIR